MSEARKPKLVFDSKEYSIERIPLNFRINIKKCLELQNNNSGISRDHYSNSDHGLEKAHEVAKEVIVSCFKPSLARPLRHQFARKV